MSSILWTWCIPATMGVGYLRLLTCATLMRLASQPATMQRYPHHHTHNRLLRLGMGAVSCKNRSGAYTIDLAHGIPGAVVPVLADGHPWSCQVFVRRPCKPAV
ncbi:hypothetical protein V8C42DRAFT_332073 [Trichoderma barbatum]